MSKREYYSFICYSHRDNRSQRTGDSGGNYVAWATWLHKELENFRVPSHLVGRKNDRGELIPSRMAPIFRDEDELPSSADLSLAIETALEVSKTLVVICSRNAVSSRFVNSEIQCYKRIHGGSSILTLIVSGDPHATSPEQRCFPDALLYNLNPDGSLNLQGPCIEPLAADVRLPGTTDEMRKVEWRQHGDVLRLAVLKLAAGILGVSFSELRPRNAPSIFSKVADFAKALFLPTKISAHENGSDIAAKEMLDLDVYFPKGLTSTLPENGVFISYAHEDRSSAKNLADALSRKNIPVWIDLDRLEPGDLYARKIKNQIARCGVFIPIISHNTQRSHLRKQEGRITHKGRFHVLEWNLALRRRLFFRPDEIFFVPVIVDDTSTTEADIPDEFSEADIAILPQGIATQEFVDWLRLIVLGDAL